MKTINLFLLICLCFTVSCKKDDANDSTTTAYTYKGNFQASAHPTSGIALVSTDKTKLLLENFKSDSGPNLNIYLTTSLNSVKADYIDLGDIKGLDGNYDYNIASSTDFTKYKYVVVWCVDFNVNFGYATLAP
ncbi:DM13 domain-containing protein [Nubsella zeaxanthinifaciens]|jgi:hypothetical protein|uniref:DM13 domain-containing protein n=1 Tax=Nubsella zeaxanthinifaciens TaxID=392412 RepID=UPI000DE3E10C|nr:DM13 domain-containing protein [Nubsella zeaxanthinifaciens]